MERGLFVDFLRARLGLGGAVVSESGAAAERSGLAAVEKACGGLCRVLSRRGLVVDVVGLGRVLEGFEPLFVEAEDRFVESCRAAGVAAVDWRSEVQVVRLLRRLGIPVADAESTSLCAVGHPVASALALVRGVDDRLRCCRRLQRAAVEGVVRGRFHAGGTRTGRVTCTDFALQGVPHELRSLFVPQPGCVFLSWDYRAMEVCVLAGLSGDEALIEILDTGGDVYRFVACCLFGLLYGDVADDFRVRAKVLLLSVLYGRGAYTVGLELGCSRAEAQALIDRTLALFPRGRDFLAAAAAYAVRHRRVYSLLGRERVFPAGVRKDSLRRQGANTVVQGSAATIFKERLCALDAALVDRGVGQTLIPLHDGALVEVLEDRVGEAVALVREILPVSPIFPLDFRLKVGVGGDWGAAEENAE